MKGEEEGEEESVRESSSEALLIKELVTVALLVETQGLIWACQHLGLGARGESALTGDTHTLPLLCPPCVPSQPVPGGQGPVVSHFLPPELAMGAGGGGSLRKLTFSPAISLPSSSAVSHPHADTSFPMTPPPNTQRLVTTHQGLSLDRGRAGQSWRPFSSRAFKPQAPQLDT